MTSYEVAIQSDKSLANYFEVALRIEDKNIIRYIGGSLSLREAEVAANAATRALKALDPDCNIKASRPI